MPSTRRSGGSVPEPVLSIRDMTVEFGTEDGVVKAVTGGNYDLFPGEILGVIGESGGGKSVLGMTMLRLIPKPPGRVVSGEAIFKGRDLLTMSKSELRDVRGGDIAMIFQDPMTSLNPVLKVGTQIAEAVLAHNPKAIANSPSVLIADEPTTALDVTIQAQIVEVLKTAQRETHAATILITHDLGLIAELADRVVVMYSGRVVELSDVFTIFNSPRHPYTVGLMNSLARVDIDKEALLPIPGQPPSMISPPPGCAFHPRCLHSRGRARCRTEIPPLRPFGEGGDHVSACHFAEELAEAEVVGIGAEQPV